MKTTLRLRILVDTEGEDNIFRDIEFPSDATFEDVHLSIQEHFGFDNSQMASFYESNDAWERGEEIMLMDMSMDEKNIVRMMSETRIGDILTEAGQKMLYIFDFLVMWTFFVEVVSVGEFKENTPYPALLLSVGDSPNQYSKSPEDLFGSMKSELLPGISENDDTEDDEEDNTDLDINFSPY